MRFVKLWAFSDQEHLAVQKLLQLPMLITGTRMKSEKEEK